MMKVFKNFISQWLRDHELIFDRIMWVNLDHEKPFFKLLALINDSHNTFVPLKHLHEYFNNIWKEEHSQVDDYWYTYSFCGTDRKVITIPNLWDCRHSKIHRQNHLIWQRLIFYIKFSKPGSFMIFFLPITTIFVHLMWDEKDGAPTCISKETSKKKYSDHFESIKIIILVLVLVMSNFPSGS